MVILTPWYDQRFRTYDFLNLTRLLKFCPRQYGASWEIWTFYPNLHAVSRNLQYKHGSQLSQSPMAIYTPYSDKHNESYSHRHVADQCIFSRKSETNSVWRKGKNFFQNRTKGIIWSKLKYDSWSFQIGAGFQSSNIFSSDLPFWTKSVLNERSSLNSMLTSNGTDLGEEDCTKVVDNFDSFPESNNTPLSDEWFRSNGFWN
jgi:hypothetical protein